MISKRKKQLQRLVIAMSEKAEMSKDRGDFIPQKYKVSKKVKRHSGRYTPEIAQKGKFSEMIENAEEPTEEYDDWEKRRDGFRDERYLEWKKIDKEKNGKRKINK